MPDEDLKLRFRLRNFSAFALIACGTVLLFGLFVFGQMVIDGVRDWRVTLVFGFVLAILLIFTYIVPLSVLFNRNEVLVRYLIGRTARYDLHDMIKWEWQPNTVGNSALRIYFKDRGCLTIPSMFIEGSLPSFLNNYMASNQTQ